MQVVDRNGRLKVEITSTVDDISVGVTTISGGTNGRVLYDNAGLLGEIAGTSSQYIAGDGSLITFPSSLPASKMVTIGRNATGSTLYKGTIVYISGSTGNRPNFVKAQANAEATSAGTFGVIESDIPNNSDGNCVTIGTIDNLDTRSTATHPFTTDTLADGDTIYLSPTTAGYVTNVKPYAPSHLVYIGKVVRTSPTNGTIVYRIQNGYELDELHDVAAQTPSNNDVLSFETSTQLWKPKSIPTLLGYTPVPTTRTISTTAPLSGGGDLSADRTLSIATANGTTTGALSSTDWNTFNGKQSALVSGTNIKTINGTTILGSGDLTISTGITIGTTAITSGTVGQVLFQGTGNVVQESANLFWDNTNGRLGIGTSSPARALDIVKTIASGAIEGIKIEVNHSSSTSAGILDFVHTQFDARFRIQSIAGAGGANPTLSFIVRSLTAMSILQSGNVNIGNTTTDAGYKLDVNGTARVSSTLAVGGPLQTGGSGFGNTMLSIQSSYPCFILSSLGGTASKVGLNLDSSKLYFSEETNGSTAYGHRLMADTKLGGLVVLNNTAAGSIAALNASAVLQADSTTRGFLPPRMTTTQKNAIATPAAGLMVYDTTLNAISYYNGTTWI